jgi:hypothetical protein
MNAFEPKSGGRANSGVEPTTVGGLCRLVPALTVLENMSLALEAKGLRFQRRALAARIGKLELADGSWVPGFVCAPEALEGAVDITEHGGWRRYLAYEPKL